MRSRRSHLLYFALSLSVLVVAPTANAEDKFLHAFRKLQLSDQFWCEGANIGDFNHDGAMDLVAGPYWWEGPDFHKRHEYYPAAATFDLQLGPMTTVKVPGFEGTLGKKNTYSDNFFAWAYDFNKDGWHDILIIGFPGQDASWFENPKGGENHWKRHKVFKTVDNESPTWIDITGDGKPEIVCNANRAFGYISPNWDEPTKPWTFHAISPAGGWQAFTHGLGVGDVNGDKRLDILEAGGWWEQPEKLDGDPSWTHHPVKFAAGGAQMYAYDVNGDGLNDVITSVAAHGFGLVWHEQQRSGEEIQFTPHTIMGEKTSDNKYGVRFSELHAIDLVDVDGDGLLDIVTGKRFWSHGREQDPERNSQAVNYWFRLARGPDKSVDWVPYQIDNDSGVGTQLATGDINGDGLPDVFVGNKKGIYILLHERRQVTPEEWEKAQPKAIKREKTGDG